MLTEGTNKDDAAFWAASDDLPGELMSIHAGQLCFTDNRVEDCGGSPDLERFLRGAGRMDLITSSHQNRAEKVSDLLLSIDHQEFR